MKGLEPPRREAPDPKSGVATNYTTSAKIKRSLFFFCECKYKVFYLLKTNYFPKKFL